MAFRSTVIRSCIHMRWCGSLDRAKERAQIDAVRFRPWLQAFADYAFDKRQFGRREIQAQIEAAESFGADGWILWNPRNVYAAEALRKPALSARTIMPAN